MTFTLKPYRTYRETGLDSIQSCPSHWKKSRLKYWVSINRITLPEHTDEDFHFLYLDISSVGLGHIVDKPQRLSFGQAPSRARRVVSPGDTLISTVRTYLKAVLYVNSPGVEPIIASTGFAVLTPNEGVVPAYVGYLVQSESFVNAIVASSVGVAYPAITENVLGALPVLIPSYEEQEAVVRFIRHVDHRVNRLIAAKRQLIALLNEQKQAIIQQAVTKGLDPSVPLSADSRPFLQHLPAQWPVFRAKLLFRQVVPPIPDDAEMVTCFRDGQVTLRRNRRTAGFTNAIWELGYQGIEPGQLVLHSMDAFAGAIGISDSSGKCSPEYVICEPAIEGVFPDYYAYLLRSLALRGLFVALCPSVRERAPRVRFNDFGSFVLPKPPMSEQREIVDYIRDACRNINTSLAIVRHEADLLLEYRTRLVADVVTGQLDVRHLDLPDVDDEPVSLIDEARDLDEIPDDDLVEEAV